MQQNGWCNLCRMKEKSWRKGLPVERRTMTGEDRLHFLLKGKWWYVIMQMQCLWTVLLAGGKRTLMCTLCKCILQPKQVCKAFWWEARGESHRHCLWGPGGQGQSVQLWGRNKFPEPGNVKTQLLQKKIVLHFTENWMPNELTPVRSFCARCFVLGNSLA